MQLTPSQVKNLMRRGLRLLLDPDLEKVERERISSFFGNHCAYCGVEIQEGTGDLDHLISTSQRGSNHKSNRVLSCKPCNAKEKRESHWQQFLGRKCGGETPTFFARKEKIEEWVHTAGDTPIISAEALRILETECNRVTTEFDLACRRIRDTKRT